MFDLCRKAERPECYMARLLDSEGSGPTRSPCQSVKWDPVAEAHMRA